MEVLGQLNDSGTTIVLITHDCEVATRLHRQVEIADGVVRADRGVAGVETEVIA